ncbi:sulfite oxidase heme-binding subunit YedZ [Aquabacter cavernae]|uniref:sulfite oxidase heme-binding subunit YedZ n=1 Tax=Aquabacter cavernae TaxID=2496029 RepID=UPI000F8D8140|nr:ferric reductase-like transmembrane domain-containing protein [Aquabacter cavernae]
MPLFHEKSGKFSPEKTIALVASVAPAVWLAALALTGDLGARPVTAAIHFTGLWAVRFLLVSLAVTPFRRIFHWPKLVLARRTLGLAALAYAALHLGLYVADLGFDLGAAAREIALRFYLTIGALAVALLLALGGTSFDRVIRRMGAKRWNALHASVYAIAVLAVVHFLIQSKLDVSEAVLMGGLLVFLFAYRVAHRITNNVTIPLLACVVLGSALMTAAMEVGWYAAATGIDPRLVLEANFQPAQGISPALWVLTAGTALTLAAIVRRRLSPPKPPAKARMERPVSQTERATRSLS